MDAPGGDLDVEVPDVVRINAEHRAKALGNGKVEKHGQKKDDETGGELRRLGYLSLLPGILQPFFGRLFGFFLKTLRHSLTPRTLRILKISVSMPLKSPQSRGLSD